jgi:AraC-like DNA-binding protein
MIRLGSSNFSDIDQLAELVDWNLSFRQIERGPFQGFVDILGTEDLIAMRIEFSRRVHQVGEPIAGMKSFGLLDAGNSALENWCYYQVDARDIVDFNEPGGFDGVSAAGLGAVVFSLGDELLARKAADLGVDFAACFAGSRNGPPVSNGSADAARARQELRRAYAALDAAGEPDRARVGEHLEDLLATMVLLESCAESVPVRRDRPSARQRLCRRAVDYINFKLDEPFTVAELCRESGASIATLERAFKDCFGIGPKRYIAYARLGAVHREITRSHSGTVTDIATRHGYWHMGQFTRDYKAFTGSLPSETLASRAQ